MHAFATFCSLHKRDGAHSRNQCMTYCSGCGARYLQALRSRSNTWRRTNDVWVIERGQQLRLLQRCFDVLLPAQRHCWNLLEAIYLAILPAAGPPHRAVLPLPAGAHVTQRGGCHCMRVALDPNANRLLLPTHPTTPSRSNTFI